MHPAEHETVDCRSVPTLTLPARVADLHAARFAAGKSCYTYVKPWAWHIHPTAGEEVATIRGHVVTVFWPQFRPLVFPFTPTVPPRV